MRLGSRIRTVAPAFPSQGPAMLAGTLSGTVIQMRRFGRNPVVRGRAAMTARSLADIPERAMVIPRPDELPAAATPSAPVAPIAPACGCTHCG